MPTVSKAARIRDVWRAVVPARPARVTAVWCLSCTRWVKPRRFDFAAGACRPCLDGRGWSR